MAVSIGAIVAFMADRTGISRETAAGYKNRRTRADAAVDGVPPAPVERSAQNQSANLESEGLIVQGELIDAITGNPVIGWVTIDGSSFGTANNPAVFSLRVTSRRSDLMLEARAHGYEARAIRFPTMDRIERAPVLDFGSIELSPAARTIVSVVSASQTPVEGALVQVAAMADVGFERSLGITDASGHLVVALPIRSSLFAQKDDRATRLRCVEPETAAVELKLELGMTRRIRLVDVAASTPISGVELLFKDSASAEAGGFRRVTDERGYISTPLPCSTFTVSTSDVRVQLEPETRDPFFPKDHPDVSGRVQVDARAAAQEIVLWARRSEAGVTLRLLESDSENPIDRASIWAGWRSRPNGKWSTTPLLTMTLREANGNVVFLLPQGTIERLHQCPDWMLLVAAPGHDLKVVSAEDVRMVQESGLPMTVALARHRSPTLMFLRSDGSPWFGPCFVQNVVITSSGVPIEITERSSPHQVSVSGRLELVEWLGGNLRMHLGRELRELTRADLLADDIIRIEGCGQSGAEGSVEIAGVPPAFRGCLSLFSPDITLTNPVRDLDSFDFVHVPAGKYVVVPADQLHSAFLAYEHRGDAPAVEVADGHVTRVLWPAEWIPTSEELKTSITGIRADPANLFVAPWYCNPNVPIASGSYRAVDIPPDGRVTITSCTLVPKWAIVGTRNPLGQQAVLAVLPWNECLGLALATVELRPCARTPDAATFVQYSCNVEGFRAIPKELGARILDAPVTLWLPAGQVDLSYAIDSNGTHRVGHLVRQILPGAHTVVEIPSE